MRYDVDTMGRWEGEPNRSCALEAVLSKARQGTSDAPLPAKGADGVTSARAAVIPAAQPRTHGESLDELVAFTPGTAALHSGLRSNGHLPTCKCWRCEKLDGAA